MSFLLSRVFFSVAPQSDNSCSTARGFCAPDLAAHLLLKTPGAEDVIVSVRVTPAATSGDPSVGTVRIAEVRKLSPALSCPVRATRATASFNQPFTTRAGGSALAAHHRRTRFLRRGQGGNRNCPSPRQARRRGPPVAWGSRSGGERIVFNSNSRHAPCCKATGDERSAASPGQRQSRQPHHAFLLSL